MGIFSLLKGRRYEPQAVGVIVCFFLKIKTLGGPNSKHHTIKSHSSLPEDCLGLSSA